MTKLYGPHLAIIRDSIAAIERYRPADKLACLDDPMLQDAVLMRLQVVGEHLARMRQIDEERFQRTADPSWIKVIGLRNIISHGYEIIDHQRVWSFINTDLDTLAASLATLPPE